MFEKEIEEQTIRAVIAWMLDGNDKEPLSAPLIRAMASALEKGAWRRYLPPVVKREQPSDPTKKALTACAAFLNQCLRDGWSKNHLDKLEELWWSNRDRFGNIINTGPTE